MTVITCETCVHLRRQFTEGYFCEAFPEGVPDSILYGKKAHRENIEGDNGFKWKPLPEFEFLDVPLFPIGKDK